MKTKYILVTGASTGIGYFIAEQFAQKKYSLILTARNEKLLAEAKEKFSQFPIDVKTVSQDLSEPGGAASLHKKIIDLNLPVIGVINNAGFGDFGIFHERRLEKITQMIQLNITSLTELSHLFIPELLKNKGIGILNVASVAGFQPGPLMTVYYASKAYVLSFSEALHEELKPFGLKVSALCPGPTITEFHKRAELENSKLFKSGFIMSAREVARIGVEGFLKGKSVVVPGLGNKLTTQGHRFLPRKWLPKLVRRVQEKIR